MPEEKSSILKQIAVGVAVAVLSALALAKLEIQDKRPAKETSAAKETPSRVAETPAKAAEIPADTHGVPKSWNLVGTWRANSVEQGMAVAITWHLRPDGTCTYLFQTTQGQTRVDGTWRYSDNLIYEEFGDGGRGQSSIRWVTESQFELTVIDNGIPSYSGFKRTYHRL